MTADPAARAYVLIRHQDKAVAYISALRAAGHRRISNIDEADFLFVDVDYGERIPRVDAAIKRGIPRFYYPHAARPPLYWDGIVAEREHTASFVHGHGHEEVMRSYGYQAPIHVTGWTYCPIMPFVATWNDQRTKPLHVLFAPAHPNRDGSLGEQSRKANAAAHKRLSAAHKAGKITLSVRLVHGDADAFGFQPAGGVTYYRVAPGLVYSDIDRSDVVVATQTLAYMAIARGKPTVMMDEDAVPYSGSYSMPFKHVASWPKYRDLLRYPLDILEGPTMDTLQAAARSDAEIADWRAKFIGPQFRPREFVRIVESYLMPIST